MPDRPGDNLPKPETPGPWYVHPDDDEAVIGGDLVIAEALEAVDARAIAALPDWIAAHDAEKARAEKSEKAEAALAEVIEWSRSQFPGEDEFNAGAEHAQESVRHILARHGYGDAE